ncbi:MAG: mechanosensitive ion channel family protein [Bacteroidia bacterium]
MDFESAYELIIEKISIWMEEFIRLLPNLFIATIVLVLGIFLASRIKNLARKLIYKFTQRITLTNLFTSTLHVFFIGVTLFTVLSILKLDKAVTSILAGAGIAGLALAFAFQDIAANFISGIFISFRRPMHVGNIVKIKDYMGKVQEINLRDTVLCTFQGQIVIIPNKEVFQNPIENFSIFGKRRFDLEVGVSYGEDLEKVRNVTLAAVKGIENLSEEDEVTMFYKEFADSSINFILRMWVNSPEQPVFKKVGNDAIMRIKKAYDENNIMIPFPIRTLDFGIKGGIPLSKMMNKEEA